MTFEEAIEVFVTGFSVTKGQTHPYLCERVDGIWVLRDGPGRRRSPRKIEVIASGFAPEEVVDRIRRAALGWHFLCHLHGPEDDFDGIRTAYKSLGYRALSTEGFFIHEMIDIPEAITEPPVREVKSDADLASIPKQGSFTHKRIPGSRLFVSWDESHDYGWVTSIPVGRAAWVSGLYVRSEFRRRGIGRAVMSKMLQVDAEHGVQTSVLLASSDGAHLYPQLGYKKIGVLQMFCPTKRF